MLKTDKVDKTRKGVKYTFLWTFFMNGLIQKICQQFPKMLLHICRHLTRNPAKASGGRPYETGSRNMAATQKINVWTPVSYSLLQTLFR